MDDQHQIKIDKNWRRLIDQLSSVDEVTDYLISGEIFDHDDRERVEAERISSAKSRKLLHILRHKGPDAYRCFIEALTKTKQQHIVDRLHSTDVSEEDLRKQRNKGD